MDNMVYKMAANNNIKYVEFIIEIMVQIISTLSQ